MLRYLAWPSVCYSREPESSIPTPRYLFHNPVRRTKYERFSPSYCLQDILLFFFSPFMCQRCHSMWNVGVEDTTLYSCLSLLESIVCLVTLPLKDTSNPLKLAKQTVHQNKNNNYPATSLAEATLEWLSGGLSAPGSSIKWWKATRVCPVTKHWQLIESFSDAEDLCAIGYGWKWRVRSASLLSFWEVDGQTLLHVWCWMGEIVP